MRINTIGSVQRAMKTYESKKLSKAQKSEMKRDEVEISSKGKEFQLAMKTVKGSQEAREAKVDGIRNDLQSNTYKVDSVKLAKAMFEYLR